MFQFTTTNVINSAFEWGYNPADDEQPKDNAKALFSADSDKGTFNVKRVMNFKKENVAHIYKAAYTPSKNAHAELNLGNVKNSKEQAPKKGDAYRLSIYIRLVQSCQSSYYSNDMVFKGKPLSVEFNWQEDAEATAKKLAQIIKKYEIAVFEKPIVTVTPQGSTLKIDATDQYQRFYTVELEEYDPEAYHGMGEYTPVLVALEESHEDYNEEDGKIEQGVEGFGTYEWLLHNLRIPTLSRTRIFAPNSDETPIPGGNYNQYTIHYCVNRGTLGMNAVGDQVTSMTTHVFYVHKDVQKYFEDCLEAIAPAEGVLNAITAGKGIEEDKDFMITPPEED